MVTLYISSSGSDNYTVDGSADNVQINQALVYANANGTPENPITVYLRGPYTYDLTDNLLAGSNTILTGDTTAILRLHNSAGWPLWKPLIGQITGVTPQNFTLSNITIDGNYANQPEYTAHDWGDGYYPGLYFQGTLANPVKNISIHDTVLKNTLTDGARISYGDNIDFYNNKTVECMHEGIYVLRSLNCDIYNNDFTIRTNSGSRCYNSQNVNIYNNVYRPYNLDSLSGNFGIQIEDNSATTDIHAFNINCYGNTLINCWGGGIWCVDLTGTSTDKVIKIHDNTISGCGRITTTSYNSGICVQGFNKIQIYNNVIKNNYNAGILVANPPSSSGYLYYAHDNVITGTLDTLSTSPAVGHGYGMANRHPSYVTVIATNNLVSGSYSGDYYLISNLNDVIITPAKTVPTIRINEDDEIVDYYINGYSSYVNGYPIRIMGYEIDTDQSVGTDKPPGYNGWVLSDFGSDGASIAFRCFGYGKDDVRRALAAWKKVGRTTVEIGGDSAGYKVSGITRNHTSKINRDSGDVIGGTNPYFYTVNFYCDEPYESGLQNHVRARKLTYSGEQWSSDNAYTGNLVKNSSFEEWTRSTTQTWIEETPVAAIDFRGIGYSDDLNQFCAVASTGTNNRIQVSSGNGVWSVPATLPLNKNNNWRGVTWGSAKGVSTGTPDGYYPVSSDGYYLVSSDGYYPISNDLSPPQEVLPGRWVAIGNTAGTDGAMYSDDGSTWVAGVTPTGNFEGICYIRDDENKKYRYVVVGTNIVIYSDNGGETWTSVVVSGSFKSVCYSPSLKRVVATATTGQVIYSDNFAATWNVSTAPSQTWEDIKRSETLGLFIAITSDSVSQQVMTSETGLSGSWTLRDTPIAGSVVTPATGDISTETHQTDAGHVYTSASMVYSSKDTSLEWTYVLPALSGGNFYRLDRVFCKLRTLLAKKIAYLKVTIQAASLYNGVETKVKEWTNNTTSYVSCGYNVAIESATAEQVTLRFYMKTSDSNYRAAAIDLGFKVTTAGTTGGTVTYSYNQWTTLTEAPDLSYFVAFSKNGTGNRVMNSVYPDVWLLGSSSSDSAFSSVCYAPDIHKFVAVSTDGHISTSDNYGVYKCPDGWTLAGAGTSRSEIANEGYLSLSIIGDGTTEQPGMITQPAQFAGGVTYSITGCVKKIGTSGKAVIDIYSNSQVVSSLEWTDESDFTTLQNYFKFDFAPADALIRIHGAETPGASTQMYFDSLKIQRLSDLDIDEIGAEILTSGTVETTPSVSIEAQGILSGSVEGRETAGNSNTHIDSTNVGATTINSYQHQDFFDYTVVGKPGVRHRVDNVKIKACAATSGVRCDSKIEIYMGSKLEKTYTFSSTSVLPNYTTHSASPSIMSEAGQSITFKYYLKSGTSSKKVYIRDASSTVTEVLNTPTVATTAGVSIFNVEDPLTVMQLCKKIFPGLKITINADGTGNLRYSENFSDSRYQSAVLSRSGDSYSETLKQVLLTGSLVWEFPSIYPYTGIPYINMYVVSGIPKFEISIDNSTWYACDSNTTENLTNIQITRELDYAANLHLYGQTTFYLRLTPASGSLTIKAINLFSYITTIDAELPTILPTGAANTFQVSMTNNVPCTISLKYPDKHWM